MTVSQKIIFLLTGVIAMLSLSACNGIFEDIYDEPLAEEKNEYGFIFVDSKTNTGRIYIDATDYTEWHYIDLHGQEVTTKTVEEPSPTNFTRVNGHFLSLKWAVFDVLFRCFYCFFTPRKTQSPDYQMAAKHRKIHSFQQSVFRKKKNGFSPCKIRTKDFTFRLTKTA